MSAHPILPAGKPMNALGWPLVFSALLGCFLGFALIKFGNPVILDDLVRLPASPELVNLDMKDSSEPGSQPNWSDVLWQRFFQPWSMVPGLWMLGLLLALGLKTGRIQRSPTLWLGIFPLVWWGWQLLAAFSTVEPRLTQLTLLHFTACLACLFLGWYGLSGQRNLAAFWPGLTVGLALVLYYGFNQHYGGLEAMRRFLYERSDWSQLPPELIKRVTGGRIFSTLVYPNALAGVILLLLPPACLSLYQSLAGKSNVLRGVLVGVLAYAGLACLVWSGSKAGWLIAVVMTVPVVSRLPLRRSTKTALVTVFLLLGLVGFFVKYSSYFAKGATSVGARFDYWRAAVHIATRNPWLGTGPGTFAIPYRQLKSPEAEMARLVHNDYLEQASDSGIPGFLAYSGFVFGLLVILYRKSSKLTDGLPQAVWIGLLGWFLQGFIEFGLYIPAAAWSAFVLLGWLWGLPGLTGKDACRQKPASSL